jgi:hypothetical protein
VAQTTSARPLRLLCRVALVGLAGLACLVSPAAAGAEVADSETAQIASTITGRNIAVHCVALNSSLYGYTVQSIDVNGNSSFAPDIYLANSICVGLNRMIHYRAARTKVVDGARIYNMGLALITLVHESMHIKLNNGNEGIVDCYATHHLQPTLDSFHLPAWVRWQVLRDARDIHSHAPAKFRTVC